MKRIAVLTSGGDAPGMNAAIRAVVRAGIAEGWEVYGVRRGFSGLIGGDMRQLEARDVGGILQQAGTFLGSSRCREFRGEEGRIEALHQLAQRGIGALVVIGGNGSQSGAWMLSQMDFPVVGVASTIDNDLYGTEITIGVDTALNIALEAIDRLKVTASAHQRAFLVEVMGRNCGYLALMAGLAGGAEAVVIPEVETDPEQLWKELAGAYRRGKAHALVVVAEGASMDATRLKQHFEEHRERMGFELRTTILGHVQRGGTPYAFDRLLASRLGAAAVATLAAGRHGLLIGRIQGDVAETPLTEVVANQKPLDLSMLELARMLAR